MNFKKIYSESMDDIHGNPEVLDKILSYSAPKKSFSFKYAFSTALVCLAVAAIVVVNPFMTEDPALDNPSNLLMVAENMPGKARSIEPEVNISQETDVLTESVEQPPVTQTFVPPEIVSDVPEPVMEEISGLNINQVDVLTGSGAFMARTISETVMMTAEEYKDYIGADIPGSLAVLKDMVVTAPEFVEAVTDENGGIISEKAVFHVHTEDYERFAEITVSKTQNIDIALEGLEVSDVCGNEVTVISDGTDYYASFSIGDAKYLIVTCGIDETELNNLLISLNGGF